MQYGRGVVLDRIALMMAGAGLSMGLAPDNAEELCDESC